MVPFLFNVCDPMNIDGAYPRTRNETTDSEMFGSKVGNVMFINQARSQLYI